MKKKLCNISQVFFLLHCLINLLKLIKSCLGLVRTYSIFVYILENQHHGKSCYVGVWGDIYTYSYKLIYIPFKKENMLKLPVEIPVGPAGKLSNAVPSFNNLCCPWARCFACDCWRVVDCAASTCQSVNVTQGITGKGHICPVDNPWINKRYKLKQCMQDSTLTFWQLWI